MDLGSIDIDELGMILTLISLDFIKRIWNIHYDRTFDNIIFRSAYLIFLYLWRLLVILDFKSSLGFWARSEKKKIKKNHAIIIKLSWETFERVVMSLNM